MNRRRGEAILIDGGIRIVVLDSDRRGARLGIEAPDDTRIRREELAPDHAAEKPPAATGRDGETWAAAVPVRDEPKS